MYKAGVLLLSLLIGSYALPAKDLSSFFDDTSRIIGGTVAGNAPHMVALSYGRIVRSFLCGASLVTERHVLTAAHCLWFVVNADGSVDLSLRGTLGSNRLDSGGTQIAFARGIVHENYTTDPIVKNDIGILVSTARVHQTDTIKIINLSYDFVEGGVPTTIFGWGRTFEGGPASEVLMQLNAKVVDGDVCIEEIFRRATELGWIIPYPPVNPKVEICAFSSPVSAICQGDSGGALLRADTNEQIGIASWVLPCARNAPDVFVRVSGFKDWLKKHLV